MPYGWKGVFLALASGGVDLRVPRLRAGGPARRREPQPEAEHPARDHRRRWSSPSACTSRSRWRSSPRSTRPASPTAGARSRSPARRSCSGRSPGSRRRSGSAGSRSCSTRTRSSRPAAPASSTPARARACRSRSRRNGYIPRRVRPAHAQRHAALRDRVLVPLRPGALPAVPRLAAARRLHLRRGRPRLRDGAALARRAPAPGPGAAAPLPAARGLARGAGRVRGRERDPALHRLGRRLEADRRDPDRLRAPDALGC